LICWPQHHNLCLEVARDRIGSITVEANTLIAPVHDRMPAIVESKDFKR
jgi:putative SOS response-associated peptidase YedK